MTTELCPYTVSLIHRATPLLKFSLFFTHFSMRVVGAAAYDYAAATPHGPPPPPSLHSNAVPKQFDAKFST